MKKECDICKRELQCEPYICSGCNATICDTDCMKKEKINMVETVYRCPICGTVLDRD